MTLSFTQTINGKPNYFIEKIWQGLQLQGVIGYAEYLRTHRYDFADKEWDGAGSFLFPNEEINPKLHTIRHDSHNRWRAGMKIHPVINNRTPQRFQFAPVLECKSVQRIDIKDVSHMVGAPGDNWIVLGYPVKDVVFNLAFEVKVDGIAITEDQIRLLAINDGFDSVDDFFSYFNKDFTGKIIHWSDKKY